MGLFDTVLVPCPKCGELYDAQSKGGDCDLDVYDFPSPGAKKPAPIDVMEDVNRHAPFTCSNCGAIFKALTMSVFENFARDMADGDCDYSDDCPDDSWHRRCNACKARLVLGFETAQEYFDCKDRINITE